MLFSVVGEKYPFPTHRHRMRAELAGNVWGVGGVGWGCGGRRGKRGTGGELRKWRVG